MKDANYNKKRQSKAVSFLKKEHAEILDYANNLPDFSGYVRHLLAKDLEKKNDKARKRNDTCCDTCCDHHR